MSEVSFHGPIHGRNVFAGNTINGGNVQVNLSSDRPDTPPNPSSTSIPFSRDPNFVPRGDILDTIRELCSQPAGRAALVGLGGVGKSQLAIEYAHQLKDRNDNGEQQTWVFWVHASTIARIEESFKAIANVTKVSGRDQPNANIKELVCGWLSNEAKGSWCIILDSADDYDVLFSKDNPDDQPLASYLPQSRNGSILITTRNRDLAYRLTGNHQAIIKVGPMIETDALKLLENRLGQFSTASTATDLVRALEYIPLAISQAAAYIQARSPRITMDKYLAEFRDSEKKRIRLLDHDAGDIRRDGGASNTILTTWQISFIYISSKRHSAADLLSLMSFFNRQGIPEWLLKSSRETIDNTKQSQTESTDSESENDHDADYEFEEDIKTLTDFSLIIVTKENTFEMHGLVQLSTRRWLEDSSYEVYKERYIVLMNKWFPNGEYKTWNDCKVLFPHIEEAVNNRPKDKDIKEIWANLLQRGGWYAFLQGIYRTAEDMLYKAKRVQERGLGIEDAETLVTISCLASTYRNQGRWEEAEKLEVQVMETSKTKLGVDHPHTLTSMVNLAFTWKSQGRHNDALLLMETCAAAQHKVLGPIHPDTISSVSTVEEWRS